jgi:hypothetical protein
MEFIIPLIAPKIKPHQSMAMHALIAFALMGFGTISYVFYAYSYVSTQSHQPLAQFKLWALIMLVFGLLLFMVIFFRKNWLIYPKNNRLFRIFELVLCITFVALSYMHNEKMPAAIFGILSAGILFALIKEGDAPKEIAVIINDAGIQLPPMARNRQLKWTETDSVMLKHGTITIECADNHFYQWNTNPINFDIAALDAFCKLQVEQMREQRIKEW